MLSQCRAYVVAQTSVQNRSLVTLASRAGFGSVASALDGQPLLSGTSSSELVFFFLHYRLTDEAKRAVIERLRASVEDTVRFAPILLIIDDQPFETFLRYVQFGFDDIITLPEKQQILVDRLMGQLNADHLYVQSEDYLGPDRRRMEVGTAAGPSRREADTPHVRLTIHRSPDHGVQVRRREFAGRARPAHDAAAPRRIAGLGS
jgi:PleD family two-component response regulator